MALNINDTEARRQYTATAGQTVFAVPFTFFENSELRVFSGETELVYAASPASASEFSVSGANNDLGGSITLGAPGASAGDLITIVQDVPVERLTDFPLSGPFQIESLNIELSKIVAMIRQAQTTLGRTITSSVTDSLADFVLPSKAARANKWLAFSSLGNVEMRESTTLPTYSFGFFFVETPEVSGVLCIHVAPEAFTIPANFATPSARGSCGTNPTASYALDVQQNGTTIGTITISDAGAFTFATAGGTAKTVAAGDTIKIVAPAIADATVANVAITIRGTR